MDTAGQARHSSISVQINKAQNSPKVHAQMNRIQMPQGIDLWFVEPERIASAALLNAYRDLLTADEHERGECFHFAKHRRDYLITRALVRTVLSRRVGLAPQSLRFKVNAFGRPYLQQRPELSFNISHTDGMIMLAIASDGEIGVDIERLGTSRATQDLAEHCFAPGEAAALRMVDPSQLDELFFSYWTLKEAYIKARGLGLSLPFDRFEFDLMQAQSIEFLPPQDRPPDQLTHFWLLRPSPAHLCAVCALDCRHIPLLNARHVVPLVSEKSFDIPLLRSSVSAMGGESSQSCNLESFRE
jgi:4'-phosphopantetheinyl transferase